jgi:hypothetical protein
MTKKRTTINTQVIPKSPKGLRTSAFLLTIVPNRVTLNPNSPQYKQMEVRLSALGDFILSKKNLFKMLKFPEREGEPIRTREENIALIESVNDDRTAAVEIKRQGVLHLHIYVEFKHRTYLQFDRERLELVSSKILGLDAKTLHINIRSQGTNSFLQYVQKYNSGNRSIPLPE